MASKVIGAAVYNGVAYCACGDPLYMLRFNGSNTWLPTNAFIHGNQTENRPAMLMFNNMLYCVHTGSSTLNSITNAVSNRSTSDGLLAPLTLGIEPLIQGLTDARNDQQELWFATFSGVSWTQDVLFGAGNMSADGPSLAIVDFP